MTPASGSDRATDRKVALVTGVSSGLGQAIAGELVAAGHRVFGTVRSGEAPAGVESLRMDVRDEASVQAAVDELLERARRIDVLVNNAGSTLVGAIEETEAAQAKALFDVNFFGATRVTQAVLPTMRAQGSGRIVFISSILGFLPHPFMGFYAASKHAIEGYAESLDHEIRQFGVRALLVEPGYMNTSFEHNAARASRSLAAYAEARDRVGGGIHAAVARGDAPALVARAVSRALAAGKPRLRYPVGKRAGLLARLRSFVPASLFDRSLRKEMRID